MKSFAPAVATFLLYPMSKDYTDSKVDPVHKVLDRTITELKEERKELKEERRQEMAELRNGLAAMGGDMSSMKEVMRNEMTGLKEVIARVDAKMAVFQSALRLKIE